MRRILSPFLPLLGLGLLAFIFFVKVDIPWEKVSIFWVMAFVFHLPLILFLIAAVMVEIRAVAQKRDTGRFNEK